MGSLEGASLLLTGGTGSFGKRFVKRVLEQEKVARLVVIKKKTMKLVLDHKFS